MKLSKKQVQAVHVGISGFPNGPAAINKCKALYGSLLKYDVNFLLINNRPIHTRSSGYKVDQSGTVEGMQYVYTTLSPYKSKSFIIRRLSNITGRLQEGWLLIKLGFHKKIDIAFYYPTDGSGIEVIFYWAVSRIFRFRIIAHYVEYRTAFQHTSVYDRIANRWFDNNFMRYVDAVLPISDFLIQSLRSHQYKKPIIKIPPLVDFSLFGSVDVPRGSKCFFYVGTAAYMSAVEFILEAFQKLGESNFELHLLVNGNELETQHLNSLVQGHVYSHRIKCFSRISFGELVRKYKESSALLIALTDRIQDTARFPQKIAEYLASGNPIITTRNGEIPNYLTDGESALICSYSTDEFSQKMKWVTQNPDGAQHIGTKGHEIGLRFFDVNSYSDQLKALIDSLLIH